MLAAPPPLRASSPRPLQQTHTNYSSMQARYTRIGIDIHTGQGTIKIKTSHRSTQYAVLPEKLLLLCRQVAVCILVVAMYACMHTYITHTTMQAKDTWICIDRYPSHTDRLAGENISCLCVVDGVSKLQAPTLACPSSQSV